jgi:hypothetical protein
MTQQRITQIQNKPSAHLAIIAPHLVSTTMTFLQSLIPTNFAKKPSKKFERKHQQYLKNKKAIKIARLVDQLTMQQLARKAKQQLSLSSPPTPTVDVPVPLDLNTGNDSDSTFDSHKH